MKKLYKQFNELKIDEDLEAMPVSEQEKARVKSTVMKQKKKSHLLRNLTAAAILFVGSSVTLGVAYPAIASQIPVIGGLFALFNDERNPLDDYDLYASDIGIVMESNGVSVTVTNAVYDGESITIAHLIESEIDLGEWPMLFADLTVEGYEGEYLPTEYIVEKIGDNQYAALSINPLMEEAQFDSVNVSWNGNNIVKAEDDNDNYNPIAGDWTFNFSLDALEGETTQFENITSYDQGIELNVVKMMTTPISTVFYLTYETDESVYGNRESIFFAGASMTDNFGNELKILPISGYGDDPYKAAFRITASAIPEEVTSLIITPRFGTFNQNVDVDLEIFTIAPIEIPLQ